MSFLESGNPDFYLNFTSGYTGVCTYIFVYACVYI